MIAAAIIAMQVSWIPPEVIREADTGPKFEGIRIWVGQDRDLPCQFPTRDEFAAFMAEDGYDDRRLVQLDHAFRAGMCAEGGATKVAFARDEDNIVPGGADTLEDCDRLNREISTYRRWRLWITRSEAAFFADARESWCKS